MVRLNPLAIFHKLGESTRVDAQLTILPDERERESYSRVTGVPPLTPRMLRKDALPEKLAISLEGLREIRRWAGSLVFSRVVVVCVQEMYMQELGRGAGCAFDDLKDALVHDTTLGRKTRSARTSFVAWRDTWARFKGCRQESAWRVSDDVRFTELHKTLAPERTLALADSCSECPVCFDTAEVFASCGHAMCATCRLKWKGRTCPTCRADTPLWYCSRVTTLSVLKHALARWPARHVLFLDLVSPKFRVDTTVRLLNMVKVEGVTETVSRVSGFDRLTHAASSGVSDPVIIVSGTDAGKNRIDFAVKYLRSVYDNGDRLPVLVCLNGDPPIARKRKRSSR